MFGRLKKIVSLVISMALISYITMPSIGSSAEELTSSQRTERQLEEIIDTYGEENIIFDDGLSLYIGDEVELSAVTEDGSEIEYISNDDKVFEVINSKLIAKGEGVTFLIAKVKDKYHLSQVYVAEQEISTFAIDEKSIERESRGYYLVYVDAGHGGKDPGTVANGIREKDINLSIALKVSNKLQQKGVQVVMNRETDVFVDFKDTANHANSVNADVFVSIHSNSAVATSANGIETFYTKSIDVPYGKEIHSRLIKNTGAYDRGLKQDIYYVTNHTVMPAVLVESGFLTNATEASKLNTDAYQEKIANAIVDGVMEYLINNVDSASLTGERIYGANRYATSYKLFEDGWTTSDTAILVTGDDYPDALSAAPLAGKYDAPILLVQNKSLNSQQALKDILINKGVKHAYIIGGTGVIPSIVEDELNAIGITSKRLAGSSRYSTSVEVAKELGSSTGEVAIAYGEDFADGLSISSIAAAKGLPILLSETNSIPGSVKSYMNSNNISKTYIIGGEGVISNNVANQLVNVERLGGKNRYETNLFIFNRFKDELNLNNIYLASGLDFPDALSSSALAAKDISFVALTDTENVTSPIRKLFSENADSIGNVNILGSNYLIKDSVVKGLGISIR